jgi:translocation and assembly module TamB
VVLKSAQPVVVAVTAKEARIQPVRLTGRDTNLEISGTVPFSSSAGGADLAVRGGVNLAALQLVNPSLLARGIATVEASVRGALANPALSGRMDLKGASLYLKDVTTGLDNVNGGVLFNRNRATIDKLTAQLGTGTLTLGGFVEFGSTLIYRLQATAQQVRFRLPIDLSTTFSANLALDGTSDASTLSGTLTLNRAAFNPHTDLGELFAAFSSPVPEAGPNDYLRGVQFNVRVASAPNFEFQTSLTRDVQSEVDLRLRGTPRQPLLLGSISVDAGEVQVFGNQYTIDRGDVRFTNAVRIEPVFDLALETKVSGVTVNITFTGTVDRLRTNYSSDPPLEPSKIIALLAVGRDPTQSAATASAEAAAESTDFAGAGGGLLSQALSAQLSSKLQRFLGASRVKIDPTMTGIDNTPQARLTFEQQVSKDVTMTYITNLNYTAEQIVRLQWDLNRNWSAIAVRDANGLFGIDFQYRRRFK